MIVERTPANPEISLSGTADELRALAAVIREGGEIEPVRVTRGAGDVLIESAGDSLLITGSPDKLDVLADTVEGQAEHPLTPDGRPAHTHVDYFPGHFYLHPDSVPVVITTRMAEPKGL